MHSIHIYIYICYVHIDILYVKQHELSWSCAASGQGSSPQMMAPGSSRYPRARQQHMFVTWHVQSMHTHNIQYIYIYFNIFNYCIYYIYIHMLCFYEHVFINWRIPWQKLQAMVGQCPFCTWFLGHINFNIPSLGRSCLCIWIDKRSLVESLLQTWWPFRNRHLDGFKAWISLAFSIPHLQPLDQLRCSPHLLHGFWTRAEGEGKNKKHPKSRLQAQPHNFHILKSIL